VHAFATCGHELGHLADRAAAREAAPAHGARHILHLGANLGCASDMTLFLRAADPAMAEHMQKLLCSEGYPEDFIRVQPISTVSGRPRPGGTRRAGASMAGANQHFHAQAIAGPAT
jgi:hypothetical protein